MRSHRPDYRIVNVILTGRLSAKRLYLDEIAATYDGKIIRTPPSVVVRRDGATISFHLGGAVVVSGACTVEDARKTLDEMIAELHEYDILDPEDVLTETRIDNLVAVADLGGPVDLERFAYSQGVFSYDPSVSPGLTFKPQGSQAVCQLQWTGKVTILGSRSTEEIERALDELMSRVDELVRTYGAIDTHDDRPS